MKLIGLRGSTEWFYHCIIAEFACKATANKKNNMNYIIQTSGVGM